MAAMEFRPYDIDYLLDEVVSLPSLPSVVARVTEMVDDPECTLAAIGKAIAADPALSMKTLRLVNAAQHGLVHEVNSVERAAVLLGGRVIKNMVLAATIMDTIGGHTERFHRHCVATGVMMRVLANNALLPEDLRAADEAFVVGLLHDVGVVFLDQYLSVEYADVRNFAAEKQLPWWLAEQEVLGLDHALVGARLAEKWRLPPVYVQVIRAHHEHNHAEARYQPIAALLAIADYIVNTMGYRSHDAGVPEIEGAAWEISGLDKYAIITVCEEFCEAAHAIDEIMHNA